MEASRVETLERRLRSETPLVGSWLRRSAAQALAHDGSAEAIRVLAEAIVNHFDFAVRRLSATALHGLTSADAINAASAVWQETRHEALAAILCARAWQATSPLDLQVLTALKTGRRQDLLKLGAEIIEPIAQACADSDPTIAAQAATLLGELEDPVHIDALCDLIARSEHSKLRKMAVEKGYTPREPGRRALFFFLTGQSERYQALDFDHRLLRAHYEMADDELRQSISSRVRESGRPELTGVIQGGREKRQLSAMTSREWEAVISVLAENRRWEDLWAVVFEAPPEWSAEALGLLKHAGYRPVDEAAGANFDRLCKLRPAEGRHLRLYLPVPHCRTILEAHEHGVRTLAFAPDGKTLATGSNDTIAMLWEVPGGRLRARLAGHSGSVLALAFSPDGKLLGIGRADQTARLWNMSNRQLKATLQGHTGRVTAIAFSPDSQVVATGGNDSTARLWNVGTRECQAVLAGHNRGVMALAFAPDGKILATGSHDESILLWSVFSGQPTGTLTGHTSSVFTLAFSPDGRTLATGSSDGTIRLWHVATEELKAVLEGHKGTVMTLAFSPDGKRLATGSLDRTVRIWDLASGQLKTTLHGHTDEVNTLAFSPDGRFLATGSRDSTARLWEMASSKPLIAMTREDLEQVQKWGEILPNPEEARRWHFVAALLRYRFRYDIELSEVAGRVFDEFDIEIDERASGTPSPHDS
jgi:dipeptidyl aminopeptidase/acylaminoacyl peptidase